MEAGCSTETVATNMRVHTVSHTLKTDGDILLTWFAKGSGVVLTRTASEVREVAFTAVSATTDQRRTKASSRQATGRNPDT
jgi:hypothetical protein